MRISVKCSSAVHILLMIAVLSANRKVTSEFLASSVGCNPVDVRRLLSSLKKAGLVEVPRGTGGATLKMEPKDISLLDIYSAVDSTSLNELIGVHTHAEPRCLFGRNIEELLVEPYTRVGDAVRETMAKITLEELLVRLQGMEPGEKICWGIYNK